MLSKKPGRKNTIWKYYNKKNDEEKTAMCRICYNTYSFRTSVTNLRKHINVKHPQVEAHVDSDGELNKSDEEAESDRNEEDVEEEMDEQELNEEELEMDGKEEYIEEKLTNRSFELTPGKKRKNRSIIWKYYVKDESRSMAARCKLCNNLQSYRTTASNLMKHLKTKHFNIINDDSLKDSFDDEQEVNLDKNSAVGSHFKCLSTALRITMCLICNERLNTLNVETMKRHLIKQHPNIELPDDVTNVLLTSEGEVYEINSNDEDQYQENDEKDDESDNMDIDAVYLDDYEESSPEEPPEKQTTIKKRLRTKPENTRKYKRASVSSVEMFRPVQKKREKNITKKDKKDDPLEYFGSYLICLMRELPKHVSNQLQTSFVKQIMDAQLTHETQVAAVTSQNNSYSITIGHQGSATGTLKDLPINHLVKLDNTNVNGGE